MKSKIVSLVFVVFLFILPFQVHAKVQPKISMDEQKVIYPLPFPGILPDNPLYLVKAVRDDIFIIFTRDAIKKAQLYVLLSDKHSAAAIALMGKGKEELAIKELKEAEKSFFPIPRLLQESSQQGVSPSNDFMTKLYQSNLKHGEIVTEVMKKATQAHISTLNTLLDTNKNIKLQLDKVHKK